jgi:predicted nucleic acid-binding protein
MPKVSATVHGVLCDTSYFIRWAKPDDALHPAAQAYLKFLVEGGHELYVSTIALAEYAVRDSIANLPLRYFRVLPFNIDHSQRAGEYARAVFEARKNLPVQLNQRSVIPNDTKLFAQADVMPAITHYLTADRECEKVYTLLKAVFTPQFQFVHLSTPWHQTFGCLDLPT